MRTTAFILASWALLAVPIGSAGAGQCTSEIDRLTSALDRETVGSGSTNGSAAAAPDAQQRQAAQNEISTSHDMAAAMATLERARLFDRHGSETECLSAVGQAKLLSGSR
jgi:hypothetical protein